MWTSAPLSTRAVTELTELKSFFVPGREPYKLCPRNVEQFFVPGRGSCPENVEKEEFKKTEAECCNSGEAKTNG